MYPIWNHLGPWGKLFLAVRNSNANNNPMFKKTYQVSHSGLNPLMKTTAGALSLLLDFSKGWLTISTNFNAKGQNNHGVFVFRPWKLKKQVVLQGGSHSLCLETLNETQPDWHRFCPWNEEAQKSNWRHYYKNPVDRMVVPEGGGAKQQRGHCNIVLNIQNTRGLDGVIVFLFSLLFLLLWLLCLTGMEICNASPRPRAGNSQISSLCELCKALDSNSIPAQRVLQRGANTQCESLGVRGRK